MVTNPQYGEKYHLMRTWYRTDATRSDSEYLGAVSDTIPGAAMIGRDIVNVDWSQRGSVEVTYIVPGQGSAGDWHQPQPLIDHGEACVGCTHDWKDHNIHVGCTAGWVYNEEGLPQDEGCYCQLSHSEHSSKDER